MKFLPQYDQMDCGTACLAMIASSYGKQYPVSWLREHCFLTREGVSLLGISEAAKHIGFTTLSTKLTLDKLIAEKAALPVIVHWNQNHFVVLYKISQKFFTKQTQFHIADPGHGIIKLSEEKFKTAWLSNDDKGVALFLEPTGNFYEATPPKVEKPGLRLFGSYMRSYTKQLFGILVFLLLGTGLTLIFPFLTQALIDRGVNARNLSLITTILLAQLSLFVGQITFEVIRNWLVLYVGTRISIQIISAFLRKLLQLPIRFFDTKMMGDFQQRIQDNSRIEQFLTSHSLVTFFSIISLSVYAGVLWYYDFKILFIYIGLTALALIWAFFWLRKRQILDYYRFQERSRNQNSIYEIINGVAEMKLNQFEDYKRREWEQIQQQLFKINKRILKIDQFQISGFELMNHLKNILVTFLAATYVVKGNMTLGTLLAISYIIGQLNSPVNQLVNFFRSLQDARLSLDRLNEVQTHPEEEQSQHKLLMSEKYLDQNGIEKGIYFRSASFQYEGPKSAFVLKDINLFIPEGKVTAIVGASGSGKTTLMKLLLKFYEPVTGEILFNHLNLADISPLSLRTHCGVVMQDGFIFGDTIERNIVCGDENIDPEKLQYAMHIANIDCFVNSLPLRLNTKIGASGNGISGGQRQRILIARAVYKSPQFLFFDEATSALDAENEKIIHERLQSFFKGKTVVIIAHRLSTVKNADQIIVLENGQIAEVGNHVRLAGKKGKYYELVKNQLELGN